MFLMGMGIDLWCTPLSCVYLIKMIQPCELPTDFFVDGIFNHCLIKQSMRGAWNNWNLWGRLNWWNFACCVQFFQSSLRRSLFWMKYLHQNNMVVFSFRETEIKRCMEHEQNSCQSKTATRCRQYMLLQSQVGLMIVPLCWKVVVSDGIYSQDGFLGSSTRRCTDKNIHSNAKFGSGHLGFSKSGWRQPAKR